MRGFREIREAQRPGNSSKEVRFSGETMKKYNDLFAEDHQRAARGKEFLAGVLAADAAEKVAKVVAENPEIKESINASCDALLSQPRVDDLESPLPKKSI